MQNWYINVDDEDHVSVLHHNFKRMTILTESLL